MTNLTRSNSPSCGSGCLSHSSQRLAHRAGLVAELAFETSPLSRRPATLILTPRADTATSELSATQFARPVFLAQSCS
jgi:hypothetical protein